MYTSVRGQTLYGCEHGAKIHCWRQTLWVKQQVFEQAGEHWCRKAGFGFARQCERRKEMTVNVECE